MTKGLTYYLRQAWKKPDKTLLRQRMVEWRDSEAVVRVDKPLRLDRARALGYKAKPGFVVARVKLMRGGRRNPYINAGRRSKRKTNRKILKMNYRGVAEQRAANRFQNLEALNSYWIGEDGIYYFYEVILVDPANPHIMADKQMKWVSSSKNKGRAFRGLTSAGKKSRGLRAIGKRRQY